MKHLIILILCLPMLANAQSLNPNVTQATIKQTICVVGWTDTIRPPVSFTNRIKRRMLDAGIASGSYPKSAQMNEFKLDHIEPLSVGGAPRLISNLVIQSNVDSDAKDVIEGMVKRRICSGRITLATGRAVFFNEAWRTYK